MPATYELKLGFTLTRIIEAPPELVFEAWTDPAYLHWFFNPRYVTDTETSVDLRVGGQWRQQMIIDDETRYITGGIYREIVRNEKLVFSWGAIGGWPKLDLDRPDDALVATVELIPHGAGTEMRFQLQMPDHMAEEEARKYLNVEMKSGWGGTIDRLGPQLALARRAAQ